MTAYTNNATRKKKMNLDKQMKIARKEVNSLEFGTVQWEAAMEVVRKLVAKQMEVLPAEEFCSVDSGFHRTRLVSGVIINTAAAM